MQTVSSSKDHKSGFPDYAFPDPTVHGDGVMKPKIVTNEAEFKALGRGWMKGQYIRQNFPKKKYYHNGATKIVTSAEEERKLGKNWTDTPPNGYVEISARSADDIQNENEALKKQVMEMQNEELKEKIAKFNDKHKRAHAPEPDEIEEDEAIDLAALGK